MSIKIHTLHCLVKYMNSENHSAALQQCRIETQISCTSPRIKLSRMNKYMHITEFYIRKKKRRKANDSQTSLSCTSTTHSTLQSLAIVLQSLYNIKQNSIFIPFIYTRYGCATYATTCFLYVLNCVAFY